MVKFTGGKGGTLEDAVVIIGAKDTMQGIQAEYYYIGTALAGRGWKMERQELIEENGHHYDRITVRIDNEEERCFCFDITDFFGKV